MLTQRINEQTSSISNNKAVGNMRVNLNSANPYFQYESNPKNVKDDRLGNNFKYTQNNNIQNYSSNDIEIQKMNGVNKINLQSNDFLQYKKLIPATQTDRVYHTNNSSKSMPQNNIVKQAELRRSDQIQVAPSIICFNCSTVLHLNELKQHHADRCVRENPQVDGLDQNKALKQIDNKLERINAYFAALLKEQKQLEIKERRALVLKEVIQRALHCENQSIFIQLQNELEQEFPSSFSQILSDYLSCHAHQIKNIIKLKLSVISNAASKQQPPSPIKPHSSSSNFYLLKNYNQHQPIPSQRVQTEATPRNIILNSTEANIQNQQLSFHDQSQGGFLSPQSNQKQLQGILKKQPEVNTANNDSKNVNLFNKYLTNQLQGLINVQKDDQKNSNNNQNINKKINSQQNLSSNMENNLSGSYYLLSQSNANLNQMSCNLNQANTPQNNFSTTQNNLKYIPTFQINLNQQNNYSNNSNINLSINNNPIMNRNINQKDASNQSKILQEYYQQQQNQHQQQQQQHQQTSISQNALQYSSLNQNNISNSNSNNNNNNSLNNNQIQLLNGLNSPQRFTFANINQSQTIQNGYTIDTSNSPYLFNNQPSFSTQLSNNASQFVSTADKISAGQSQQQQLFFPPQLQSKQNSNSYDYSSSSTKQSLSVNTPGNYTSKNNEQINSFSRQMIQNPQQRSVSPQLTLVQQSLQQFQPDEKFKNQLNTDRITSDKLSPPQNNNIFFPQPQFNSPLNVTNQQDILKNITQNDCNTQQQARSFKSQRVLNFDLKDLDKINVGQRPNNYEESVKKSLNSNNYSSTQQTSVSIDQASPQSLQISKNELISKLQKKQKDLQNLQLLSQQLKSNYETHQEEINKVYNINHFSKSKSPNPSQRQQTSQNTSMANYNNENLQSILLKQVTSSNSNSTEITQILSPGQYGSMNEILTEDDKSMQSLFYNLCLAEKMNIPKNHLAHKLPISLLFKEALEMNIKGEEQMRYFIQYAFENATTYIDIDKLKKSNKNQIFKNNLANKLNTQTNK